MDVNGYLRTEVPAHKQRETRDKVRIVQLNDRYRTTPHYQPEDNPAAASWLRENHPLLYCKLFGDKAALSDSYFNTEYRVKLDHISYFPITKTAYDYGKYLMEHAPAKESIKEQYEKAARQAAAHNAAQTAPKRNEKAKGAEL